jgi:nitronate monooxygenase
MWPDRRLLDLLDIEHPIVQAPMAGAMDGDLVAAVSGAGGFGVLPCAMLDADQVRSEAAKIRARTKRPFGLGFFCHTPPVLDNAREAGWRERLAPYYRELEVDPAAPVKSASRAPFDAAMCDVVLELAPKIASFHFGLPDAGLVARLKGGGLKILSSATTVAEARWLEAHGVDAIIAQGFEAGGHRGMFLSADLAAQVGTFALVPQVADAAQVPVIAAGGIGEHAASRRPSRSAQPACRSAPPTCTPRRQGFPSPIGPRSPTRATTARR